jgi:hypothetical protein
MSEKQEIEIFKKFAQSCPYPIDINSIKSKLEPEPDIYCKLSNGTSIAFELTEDTDELLLRLESYRNKLNKIFHEEFEKLSKNLKEKFGKRLITICYDRKIIKNDLKKLIRNIISIILNENNINDNEIKISSQLKQKGIIHIFKKEHPKFKISFLYSYSFWELSTLFCSLNKKLNKKYETNANSIDLLIYFTDIIALQKEDFDESELKNSLYNLAINTKFKRVWFYSIKNDKILFVYPNLKI